MTQIFVDARGHVEVRAVQVDCEGDIELYIKKPRRGCEWINLEACQLSPEDLAKVRADFPESFELSDFKRV
jgi:hypothetical protein